MSTGQHKVIIIPGLRDNIIKPLELCTNHWNKKGLKIIFHTVNWHDGEDFAPKLKRLLKLVNDLTRDGSKVSVVGTSAGGSAAILTLLESHGKVHKAINVCGRLKVGPMVGFRSFPNKTKSSKAFAQAVKLCEKKTVKLSKKDKARIMTVRAKFGDELVPASTSIIEGVHNTTVPTMQHMLSICASLTVFSKPLIDFLKKKN